MKYEDGRAVLYRLAADGTRREEKETATGYAGALTPEAFSGAAAQRHWRYAFDARGGLEGLFNELEADPTKQRLATYETDLVGRLTSEQRAGGRKDYGWDAGGRLTKVTVVPGVAGEGGSVTTQYRYGWEGLRVARTTGAQTSTYLWAGGAPAAHPACCLVPHLGLAVRRLLLGGAEEGVVDTLRVGLEAWENPLRTFKTDSLSDLVLQVEEWPNARWGPRPAPTSRQPGPP